MNIVLQLLQIAGSLGLFLYGMKILSEGLQKSAGNKMKSVLNMMTGHRILAVLTGFLVTCLIQSSSATTVMVVSFVNAGLMNLVQAIGVILGANIGTTVTGWIVAILGFKFNISSLALISVAVGLPLIFSKRTKRRDAGEIFLGFGLLFLGLDFLQNSMPDISQNMQILSWLQVMNNGSIWNILLCVLIGIVLTAIIQSSSAAMAITLTMAYQGWIGVTAAAAMVLGQNIGTTITAFLASLGTNTGARRTAWAHILFNVIGTIIALILFKPFLSLVNAITPGDIYTMTGTELNKTLPTFLAMFHTVFNLINTMLFVPFIKQFARLIEKIIPPSGDYQDDTYHFQYVGGTLIDTPELYLLAVRDEIHKMADLACNMFSRYRTMLGAEKPNIEQELKELKHMEEYADQMQEQLSDFCIRLLQNQQAPTNASTLNYFIRVIDELESITDSCLNLVILGERKFQNDWHFDAESRAEINTYEALVQEFLDFVRDHMDKRFSKEEMIIADQFEMQIDEWRNQIGETIQVRLSSGSADVKVELLMLEMTRHLEHIGDYCTNIAETYYQAVKHTPVLQKATKAALSTILV